MFAKENDMEFNIRLRCLIMHSGFTQKQIAKALDVSQSTVSKWVHGKSEPSIEKLIGLCCQLFYITLDDLLIGNLFLDELLQEKYASKIVEQTKLDL